MKTRLITQEFIRRSNLIHANKYDYSLVKYKNNSTKVEIVCPRHGSFFQTPDKHMSGNRCKFCSGCVMHERDFVDRAIAIHGYRYDYSLVTNPSMKHKIKIYCPLHGIFQQRTEVHLRGSGCAICHAVTGSSLRGRLARISNYSKTTALFYVVTIHINGVDYNKVGITTQLLNNRFKRISYTPFMVIKTTLDHAFQIEQEMLHKFGQYRQSTPLHLNGWTEILNINKSVILSELKLIEGKTNAEK